MDTNDGEGSIKQNLQERLHDAVKQCQTHFGGRQEVATEGDIRVNTLCIEWETVLCHGFRKPKTSRLLSFGKSDTMTGVALWPLLRHFLSNEEQERFLRLRHVSSDIGRGRAWLRASINERTLENYLHTILADVAFLRTCYEQSSFVLDTELSSMLPVMAAGLSSIIFSLIIDADYLNTPLKNVDVPSLVPLSTQPAIPLVTAPSKPDFATRIGGQLSGLDVVNITGGDDDVVAVRRSKKKTKKKSFSPSPDDATTPINQSSELNPFLLDTPTNLFASNEMFIPDNDGSPYRDVSPISVDGLVDNNDDDHTTPLNDLAAPPTTSSLSSSPATSVHSINSASDVPLFVAPNDTQNALEVTNFLLETNLSVQSSISQSISPRVTMSEDELKEALKVLVKRKEEIEGQHQATMAELDQERERAKELEKEVNKLKQELNIRGDTHSQQQQALERENDLLREQLKRYVGMVQSQNQDGGEPDNTLSTKLSEMAEMYGELMEFNDHLHKDVLMKDNQLIKMAQTLQLASIPLPVSPDNLPREALESIRIIEVWIPSVIKRGRGPDVHHAYQIYVKLKNEEWNVYRRFAEFYEFHKQLQRNLQEVNDFQFPPKKVINRKTSQVIEERRLKLQDYLRFVIDLCSKPNVKRKDGRIENAIIYFGITKEQFLKVLPFFNDTIIPTNNPPTASAPSYNGL